MASTPSFDLFGTYLHLADNGRAAPVEVTEAFWPDLMAGKRHYDGRLAMASHVTEDAPHWEMHPAGEELIYLLSGAVDFVLEEPAGEEIVALRTGANCCLVPKGVWHRFRVREAGALVFITPGEGTQHRPL